MDPNPLTLSTPVVSSAAANKPLSTLLKVAPKRQRKRRSRKGLFENTVTENIKNEMLETLLIVLTKLQMAGLLLVLRPSQQRGHVEPVR